jgi:hypothetical protein
MIASEISFEPRVFLPNSRISNFRIEEKHDLQSHESCTTLKDWGNSGAMSTAGFVPSTAILTCDGCGQAASTEHISRRLQRLEWATRYRPVHIHTLLLGGVSPREERDFLYSPNGEFGGEAALALEGTRIAGAGKPKEAVHAEFQRQGFFLTHVLECPMEREAAGAEGTANLVEKQLPIVLARIRRSLKPKRMVLISGILDATVTKVTAEVWGCPLVLDEGKAFALDGPDSGAAVSRLRTALAKPLSG